MTTTADGAGKKGVKNVQHRRCVNTQAFIFIVAFFAPPHLNEDEEGGIYYLGMRRGSF